MSKVDIFREAASSFGDEGFTKEQLEEICLNNGMTRSYFNKCFEDALRVEISGFKLEQARDGVYKAIQNERTHSPSGNQSSSTSTELPVFLRDHGVFASEEDALKFLLYIIREWKGYFATIGATGVAPAGIYAYLKPTDPILLSGAGLTETQYIFKELAMHAQNSPKSNSIKFLKGGEPTVRDLTGDYGLIQSARLYSTLTPFALLTYLRTTLGKPGLTFKSYWYNYALSLKAINNYLYSSSATPKTHTDVMVDFRSARSYLTKSAECREVVEKFITAIPRGFSIALTLDFLKEFDPIFDYPKPDTHVKRIMYYLFQTNPTLVKKPEMCIDEYAVIDLLDEILTKAKRAYIRFGGTRPADFTHYLLDKIIYLLCCKEPLYLPGEPFVNQGLTAQHRKDFIDRIIRKDYLSISLATSSSIRDALADIDDCL